MAVSARIDPRVSKKDGEQHGTTAAGHRNRRVCSANNVRVEARRPGSAACVGVDECFTTNDVRGSAALIDEAGGVAAAGPGARAASTCRRRRSASKRTTRSASTVYNQLKARKAALDPDYAAEFDKEIAAAGVTGFTFQSNKADAATVAGVLDLMEERNQPLWDTRRKKCSPHLGKPSEMSDAERHVFVRKATGETESTAKLTESQKDLVIDRRGRAEA